MKTLGGLTILIGAALLTGCIDKDNDSLRKVKQQNAKAEPLKLVSSEAEYGRYIRNGLLSSAYNGPLVEIAHDSEGAYSETNLQVAGVDELDSVKYDGDYLYLAKNPDRFIHWEDAHSDDHEPQDEDFAKIRVMKTFHNPAKTEQVGEHLLSEAGIDINGFYISEFNDNAFLTVLTSDDESYWIQNYWKNPWVWGKGRTGLHLLRANQPSQLDEIFKIEIEGHFLDSRRIENNVYLVTRYTPEVDGLIYYPKTLVEKSTNQQLVDKMSINDLIPQLVVNGGAAKPLFDTEDCYIPQSTKSDEGNASIVTITRVDLITQEIQSSCMGGNTDGIYVSQTGIYHYASDGENTGFHKFSITNNDIQYLDTGLVAGDLGLQNFSFRLDEFEDSFRVLSTKRVWNENQTGWDFEHQLTILSNPTVSGETFNVLGVLPNDDNPSAIGKPGEDIYGVRYSGNRAFAITFERVDPLYVFDLSDDNDPKIQGELEVDGFSQQLHILNEDFILGVGHEADSEFGIPLGVKVELFDVSNLNSPQSVGKEVIGQRGSSTSASHDHHAFSLLNMGNGNIRLALPIARNDSLPEDIDENNPFQRYYFTDFGLFLFNINTGENAFLQKHGEVITAKAEDGSNYLYSDRPRSVLHGDSVFFTDNAQVWSTEWNNLDLVEGPQ
ncbi:beta-propeller domain-containing protein [Pleionea sediminis]|uniref:beta-propeller domain-containing protein n=1 Tax=Pleionea sediminis TaxID=2569479 RepID=UPI0011862DF3|nr:beta-propeller domain-containing protein [Pleionea sediminis]